MKTSFIEFPVMHEYNCPVIDVSNPPMGPYICYEKYVMEVVDASDQRNDKLNICVK